MPERSASDANMWGHVSSRDAAVEAWGCSIYSSTYKVRKYLIITSHSTVDAARSFTRWAIIMIAMAF